MVGKGPNFGSGPLEFERDFQFGAVGFYLALGIQLHVELHDFGNAKIPERFSGSIDGRRGRLFPGILAGSDKFNDLVDALSHIILPFNIGQDAGAPAGRKPNIGIPALKGAIRQRKARPAGPDALLLYESVQTWPQFE
jgi:hypothetical protein